MNIFDQLSKPAEPSKPILDINDGPSHEQKDKEIADLKQKLTETQENLLNVEQGKDESEMKIVDLEYKLENQQESLYEEIDSLVKQLEDTKREKVEIQSQVKEKDDQI